MCIEALSINLNRPILEGASRNVAALSNAIAAAKETDAVWHLYLCVYVCVCMCVCFVCAFVLYLRLWWYLVLICFGHSRWSVDLVSTVLCVNRFGNRQLPYA